MPAIKCKCGERLSYGAIPNTNEWLAISDVDFDKVVGEIDSEELYERFVHVLICSNCRRLLVFNSGFTKEPLIFLPEQ